MKSSNIANALPNRVGRYPLHRRDLFGSHGHDQINLFPRHGEAILYRESLEIRENIEHPFILHWHSHFQRLTKD
jgi:hypothetical protein